MGVHGGLPVHDGVEAVVGVRRVLHCPDGAVGFDERVAPLDDVPVSRLVLGLGVAGVGILDAVAEAVLRHAVRIHFNGCVRIVKGRSVRVVDGRGRVVKRGRIVGRSVVVAQRS